MLPLEQEEHSGILLTCIKRLSVVGVLSEWPLKTGFTVCEKASFDTHAYVASGARRGFFCPSSLSVPSDFNQRRLL